MKDKPKVLLIIGNQRRHLHFATSINREFKLAGVILVDRGKDVPEMPQDIDEIDQINFLKHFKDRSDAEAKHFDKIENLTCPILEVGFSELNTEESVKFIQKISPEFVFVFGSGLIKSPLIEVLPKETINLHLGLSPRYRGSATLFWPFYFLEPNFAGTTFHYLADQPDAGEIIHQIVPVLEYGDKIHDVACKVVAESSLAVIELLLIYIANGSWDKFPQKHSGKNFLDSDFHPSQLRLIYNTFDEKIVDYFLDNKLRNRVPKLIKQTLK
jgi:folate-dependent phosphoribosylglycinamide formyltransferase PurN